MALSEVPKVEPERCFVVLQTAHHADHLQDKIPLLLDSSSSLCNC